jgi:hypothetical protein
MKKLIGTLAVISMASTGAMASTARVNALQSSFHLVDALTIFGNPSDVNKLPEVALIEYGASATLGSTAQGGFLKAMDDSKFGFFLGAGSTTRTTAASGTLDFEGVENPFSVVYGSKAGDMGWGMAFTYSSSTKKSDIAAVAGSSYTNLDAATQSKMSLTGSVDMGTWNVGATLGLGDTAKTTLTGGDNATYAGTNTSLFGVYGMDTMTFGVSYGMTGTKIDKTVSSTKSTVKDSADNTIALGVVNEVKKEGADFFYGANYVMYTNKDKGATSTTTTTKSMLPVIIGVEADAASWLVLRGSVTQNVLLGSTSTKTTASVTDSISHDTKVAAGMGIKLNKSILDMTLSAATSGTVASNALGASAAYTYIF